MGLVGADLGRPDWDDAAGLDRGLQMRHDCWRKRPMSYKQTAAVPLAVALLLLAVLAILAALHYIAAAGWLDGADPFPGIDAIPFF